MPVRQVWRRLFWVTADHHVLHRYAACSGQVSVVAAQLVFERAHALGQLFGAPHVHRALIEL
jgi:hypothetical protein